MCHNDTYWYGCDHPEPSLTKFGFCEEFWARLDLIAEGFPETDMRIQQYQAKCEKDQAAYPDPNGLEIPIDGLCRVCSLEPRNEAFKTECNRIVGTTQQKHEK